MKSDVKTLMGIAMLIISGINCVIMAQTETIQYSICTNCNGNNPTMEPNIDYTISQISSDFGMRVAGGGSRFHRGIDYVPPPNASVVAVRGGVISSIVGTGLKSITIRHTDGSYYSYLHIFGNNIPSDPPANFIRYGAFVLHRIGSTGRFAILNLASGQGYCHANADVNKIITYNNRQFTLTRNVIAGDAIAPVGTSLGYQYHLHISKIENGVTRPNNQIDYWNSETHCNDPWTSITTNNTTLTSRIRTRRHINYSGNISDHDRGQSDWGTIELLYPNSNNTRNPYGRNVIQVEVEMEDAQRGDRDDRYTNVVMDADVVKVEISKNGQNQWQTIMGSNYHGYVRQNPNPASDLRVYPERMFNHYGDTIRNSNGIVPFAYRTTGDNMAGQTTNNFNGGFHPRDYYMFTDIYPRLKSGHTPPNNDTELTMLNLLADSPDAGKYKDGIYNLRSKVINIHGDSIVSDSVIFTIDNFKPFLDSIVVSIVNKEVYQIMRKTDEGRNNVINDGYITNKSTVFPQDLDIAPQDMKLSIRSSEPMEELTYSYRKVNGNFSAWHILTATNDDKTQWTAQQLLNVSAGDCYEIKFKGKDTNENGLLSVYDKTNQNDHSTKMLIPTRKATTGSEQWENSASIDDKSEDKVRFCLVSCEGRNEFPDCEALVNIQESVFI